MKVTSAILRSVKADGKPTLDIALKCYAGRPVIERHRACQAPVCASTRAATTFPRVMNGLGVAIVSTPRGVADRSQGPRQRVGEVLCIVA